MRILAFIMLLTAAVAGASEPTHDPQSLVTSFIADYKGWNDSAHALREKSRRSKDTLERVESAYRALLARYCRPGFAGEPIAFGSHSAHDPLNEKIVATTLEGERAIVKTTHRKKRGSLEMQEDYEYHLSRSDGRWYLDQVYYVAPDGKYESL